jgi:hypothetical protein
LETDSVIYSSNISLPFSTNSRNWYTATNFFKCSRRFILAIDRRAWSLLPLSNDWLTAEVFVNHLQPAPHGYGEVTFLPLKPVFAI